MKPVKLTLPVRYKGELVQFGWKANSFFLAFNGRVFYYEANRNVLYIILGILGLVFLDKYFEPKQVNESDKLVLEAPVSEIEDVLGFSMDLMDESETFLQASNDNFREHFLVQKQLLVSKYLIDSRVSRPDQLSDAKLLELNNHISTLFIETVLKRTKVEPHVISYFAQNEDLHKVETALMEQAKYHVPASIKLAQSALETAYGRRVINNNYFGIKDKKKRVGAITTTEYYTAEEAKYNKSKIVKKQKVVRNGKTLYKCTVKDHFSAYDSPWHSFRAHSLYLVNNTRYSPLFTKGKNYEAWAEKIGSSKYGGVGYATSPIYGDLLKKIIRRYHLDLLDF